MMNSYRLPNGETIHGLKSEKEYINEWRDMAEPIEEAFGIRLYGFNPGYEFYSTEHKERVDLPVWLVQRINDALKGKFYDEKPILEKRKKEKEEQERQMRDWYELWKECPVLDKSRNY